MILDLNPHIFSTLETYSEIFQDYINMWKFISDDRLDCRFQTQGLVSFLGGEALGSLKRSEMDENMDRLMFMKRQAVNSSQSEGMRQRWLLKKKQDKNEKLSENL